MKRKNPIACDTGSLVALFEPHDANHQAALAAAKRIYGPRFTVWPVITEAAYFLRHDANAIRLLLREIEMGNLSVFDLGPEDTPRIAELIVKYSDLPMDFTDAALVVSCERFAITTVFTFDKDFSIYRPSHARRFETIP